MKSEREYPNTDLMCYHCGTVLGQAITNEGNEVSPLPGAEVQCMTCLGWSVMHADGLLRTVKPPIPEKKKKGKK